MVLEIFGSIAHSASLIGGVHKKREIMAALGSNLTILGGKLNVQLNKSKSDQFDLVASTWLGVVEDVRTAIQEHQGHISIPIFTMADLVN